MRLLVDGQEVEGVDEPTEPGVSMNVHQNRTVFTFTTGDDVLQTVGLYTRQGDKVCEIRMPRWIEGKHPDVLVWGVRFFRPFIVGGFLAYSEVFGWVAPLGDDPTLPDGN